MEFKPEDNLAFSLIIELKKHVQERAIMEALFQALYFGELILIFLVITNQQHDFSRMVLHSMPLVLVVAAFTVLVLVEVAVALVWRMHLQLYNQLLFYRFAVFPLAMLFLASELGSPFYLVDSGWLSLALLGVEVLLMYMLSSLVFHECSEDQIVYSSSEYAKYLVLTDCLMVMTLPAGKTVWLPAALLLWGALAVRISCMMRWQVRRSISNQITAFVSYFKMYLLLMLVANNLVYNEAVRNKVLLASSPVVLIMLLYSLCYTSRQTIDPKIFEGEATLQEFRRFMYVVSAQIKAMRGNLNLGFEASYLMLFIAIHRNVCTQSSCILHQQSTYEEIQNSGEQSYRKTVIHKIVKKVEVLLDLYGEKNFGDVGLKVMKLQFYSVHLANKLKIKHIISTIEYRQLSLKDRLVVYEINERANSMTSAEFIDSSQAEDEYELFKKKIMEMLVLLRQFWSALTEEKVDINSLILKSSKVFPIKREVERAWRKSLGEESFSCWNIIKTYTIYCRSILHDFTRSCILEDYSKILETRLRSKQELGYMKFDSEAGVVAISLSEASLGNLHSVNNLAARLFNYFSSKEMLSLRVNDIMPEVYSVVHDDILNSFLKNRYKSINQDERLLFGRNRNGFIFPLQLQLRKLSWNTNDELIFIANVTPIKTKTAPVLCIVDLEGDLRNVSSTYSWLFKSTVDSSSNSNRKLDNIQVILPSFFKVIEECEEEHLTRYQFSEKCMVSKSTGSFEVRFSGSPLYIKGNRVGYIVEGHTIDCANTLNSKKRALDQLLRKNAGTIRFDETCLRYEIAQNDSAYGKQADDIGIPFLRTEDLEVMFGGKGNCEDRARTRLYGEGIRTFRLVNNRIELAVEQSSFASEMSEGSWRESSVLKRIQRMHEEINIENNKNVASFYKAVVEVFGVLLVATACLLIFEALLLGRSYSERDSDLRSKWKIRTLFPELLVYSYFPASLGSNSPRVDSIRSQLIASISLSSVAQWQRESMLKIINSAYVQQSITFEAGLLTLPGEESARETVIVALAFLLVGLLLIELAAVSCMFSNYQAAIQKMYSMFLSVTDRKLVEIMRESQNLYDYLLYYPNNNLQDQSGQREGDAEDGEEESPIMKKVKKGSESWDTKIAYRLAVPLLLFFITALVGAVFLAILIGQSKSKAQVWITGSEMLPSSSLATLQGLFQFLNMSGNFGLSNSFHQLQQEFERSIFSSGIDRPRIDHWLKGNLCAEPAFYNFFSPDLQSYCQTNSQKDNSLAGSLNLLDSYLSSSLNETSDKWASIVKMQFELVKPLLGYSMDEIYGIVEEDERAIQQLVVVAGLVAIALACVLTVYFVRFPLREMDEKILFTKDLISIIPSDRQRQPNITLATLTTEALEFRDYE